MGTKISALPAASALTGAEPLASVQGGATVQVSLSQLGAYLHGKDFALTGTISPAQITSDQNDYNPAGLAAATVLRLTSDAARTLTGLQGGAAGRVIEIFNVDSFDKVLANESASSSAANRFALGANATIAPGCGISLIYDSTSSRWRRRGQTRPLGTVASHADTEFVHTTGAETVAGAKTFTSALGINLNAGALPAGISGVTFQTAAPDATANVWQQDVFGNVPYIVQRRARGTLASPSAVLNADVLGSYEVRGFNGSAFAGGARGGFVFMAAQDWTTGANGTNIFFSTTPNGSTTLTGRFIVWQDGAITGGADNAQSLGLSGVRWSVVYAATGTINTSDAREKTGIDEIPEGVKRAVKRILRGVGVFRWLASIEAKGDGARQHVGVTAQAVRDAFLAEGEDPARWALFCADPVLELHGHELKPVLDEHGAPVMRLGLRPDQLTWLALAVMAEQLGF